MKMEVKYDKKSEIKIIYAYVKNSAKLYQRFQK